MTAAGDDRRNDTVVLGQTGGRRPDVGSSQGGELGVRPGWGPPPSWSQVPPFLPGAGPVVIARNNAAVVGATLGSVSLFLALMPLIGIVSWVLAPIGLVSSAVGLVVGMSRRVGRVGALWGLVTSGLALVVCAAWVALVLAL